MDNKQLQYAWAAGFIDGDGFISIDKTGDGFQAKIEATQGIEDPLVCLRNLFGGSIGVKKSTYGNYLYWRARGYQVEEILRCLLPYLVVKKRQAEIVLEFCATVHRKQTGKGFYYERVPADVKDQREGLYVENKKLNNRRLHAERLSERAPVVFIELSDDATVRAVVN